MLMYLLVRWMSKSAFEADGRQDQDLMRESHREGFLKLCVDVDNFDIDGFARWKG